MERARQQSIYWRKRPSHRHSPLFFSVYSDRSHFSRRADQLDIVNTNYGATRCSISAFSCKEVPELNITSATRLSRETTYLLISYCPWRVFIFILFRVYPSRCIRIWFAIFSGRFLSQSGNSASFILHLIYPRWRESPQEVGQVVVSRN